MKRVGIGRRSQGTVRAWPCAVLAAIGLVALSAESFAIDWTIGAGVGAAPDYEGSENYEAVPLWNLKASNLYDPNTYVQVLGPKLNSNLLPHENIRLGLSAQYVFERDDVDNNRVDNLDDTDDGFLLGVLIGYDIKLDGGDVIGVSFDPRWDVSDDIGGLFTGRVNYTKPIGQSWIFRGGFEATYASEDYMDEFFEVDSNDAARSGISQFNADDGLKDIGINLGVTYKITERWSTTGTGSWNRLVGDAGDSPIVDKEGDENQFFVGARIDFNF